MKHRFYNKSRKEQNRILGGIALGFMLVITASIIISIYAEIYLIGILTFVIGLSIIAPFFDMPSLKKSGKIIYYSSLFIAEKPKNGTLKIHGGTLFDYYYVLDKNMKAKERRNFILQQYVEGLLRLMANYKTDKKLIIRGTSYIINKRTAKKIGFEIRETDNLQKIILYYNYFNILISNSIAKKKISFPNLNNTKTFEAHIDQLLKKKEYIEKLNVSLTRAITHASEPSI